MLGRTQHCRIMFDALHPLSLGLRMRLRCNNLFYCESRISREKRLTEYRAHVCCVPQVSTVKNITFKEATMLHGATRHGGEAERRDQSGHAAHAPCACRPPRCTARESGLRFSLARTPVMRPEMGDRVVHHARFPLPLRKPLTAYACKPHWQTPLPWAQSHGATMAPATPIARWRL